jgi:hypothetical protein
LVSHQAFAAAVQSSRHPERQQSQQQQPQELSPQQQRDSDNWAENDHDDADFDDRCAI